MIHPKKPIKSKAAPAKRKPAAKGKPAPKRQGVAKAQVVSEPPAPFYAPVLWQPPPEPPVYEPTAMERVEALGIDDLCELVQAGHLLTDIATSLEVGLTTVLRYIGSDSERSTRVREARRLGAATWDEKAEVVLRDAKTVPEISRARELASHYRWRASKMNPRDFGEKIEVDNKHTIIDVSDDELIKKLAGYGIQVEPLGRAPVDNIVDIASARRAA